MLVPIGFDTAAAALVVVVIAIGRLNRNKKSITRQTELFAHLDY